MDLNKLLDEEDVNDLTPESREFKEMEAKIKRFHELRENPNPQWTEMNGIVDWFVVQKHMSLMQVAAVLVTDEFHGALLRRTFELIGKPLKR